RPAAGRLAGRCRGAGTSTGPVNPAATDPPLVRIVPPTGPAFDALAAGDLATANAACTVPLPPPFANRYSPSVGSMDPTYRRRGYARAALESLLRRAAREPACAGSGDDQPGQRTLAAARRAVRLRRGGRAVGRGWS